jgi:hypothetical protein
MIVLAFYFKILAKMFKKLILFTALAIGPQLAMANKNNCIPYDPKYLKQPLSIVYLDPYYNKTEACISCQKRSFCETRCWIHRNENIDNGTSSSTNSERCFCPYCYENPLSLDICQFLLSEQKKSSGSQETDVCYCEQNEAVPFCPPRSQYIDFGIFYAYPAFSFMLVLVYSALISICYCLYKYEWNGTKRPVRSQDRDIILRNIKG